MIYYAAVYKLDDEGEPTDEWTEMGAFASPRDRWAGVADYNKRRGADFPADTVCRPLPTEKAVEILGDDAVYCDLPVLP